MSSVDWEKQLNVLKNEIRGLLISSPKGVTVTQFLIDYKKQLGKAFPFRDFQFNNPTDFLTSLTDTVKLQKGILIPLCSNKVGHIDAMVSRQKQSTRFRHLPTRVSAEIINDSKQIRKPVQLPLETKQSTSNSVNNVEEPVKPYPPSLFGPKDLSSEKGPTLYNGYHNDFKKEYNLPNFEEQDESSMFHWRIQKGLAVNSTSESIHSDELKEDVVEDPYYGNIEYCNGPYVPEKEYVEENDEEGSLNIGPVLKQNLETLLSENPDGIPLSKLLTKYGEKFNRPFNYREFGFQSVREFVHSLPNIFRCEKRRGFSEFILYDKNQPICGDKKPKWIPQLIQANVEKLVNVYKHRFPDGICETDFLQLYEEEFKETIDLQSLHFNSLSNFLNACSTVMCQQIEDNLYILPKLSDSTYELSNDINVLPPMSEMSFLFKKFFGTDECDGSVAYKQIDTSSLQLILRVCISDVITPNDFWMQLESNIEDLRRLMIQLNDYYDHFEDNHILDPSVAIKDLVCAVRFDIDKRWHRCKIIQNMSQTQVQVHYVDYGTTNVVNVEALRKLSRKFINLPAQGINASLDQLTYPPNLNVWSTDAIDFIYNVAMEKKFTAEIVGVDMESNKLNVLLYNRDDETETINDLLMNKGYAVHSSMVRINQNVTNIQPQPFSQSTPKLEENNFLTIDDGNNREAGEEHGKRVRTPPGYPSKVAPLQTQSESVCSFSSAPCDHFQQLYSEFYELHQRFIQFEQKMKEIENHNIYNCSSEMQELTGYKMATPRGQNPVEFAQGPPLFPQQFNSFHAPFNPTLAPRSPVRLHPFHPMPRPQSQPVQGNFNYYQMPTSQWHLQNVSPRHLMFNQPPLQMQSNYHMAHPPQPRPMSIYKNSPLYKNVPRHVVSLPELRKEEIVNKENKDTLCLNLDVKNDCHPETVTTDPSSLPVSQVNQEEILNTHLMMPVSNNWNNCLSTSLSCETTSADPVEPGSAPLSNTHLSPKSTEDFSLKENLLNSFSKKMSYGSSKSSSPFENEIENISENGLKVNTNEDDPFKELNNGIMDSIMDSIEPQDLTKRIMKIRVAGSVGGGPGDIHILLLKENENKKLVVLLSQLLKNYSPDISLETIVAKRKQPDLPIYDIFVSDHIPLFQQLRKENLISNEQLRLHVVNFEDVGRILDVICSEDDPDLIELKGIFQQLPSFISVEDEFWHRPRKD